MARKSKSYSKSASFHTYIVISIDLNSVVALQSHMPTKYGTGIV